MKAAIYARYSSDKQSDNSIEDQVRNCTRYAERNQLEIVLRFEDRAITGAVRMRQQYQAMLAAAERGEFDVLLVDDLSRLTRTRVETMQVVNRFKFWGKRIVGVTEGYDSGAKGEKIQSTMRGLMNELYLDDLRDKTHRGLYGKALNGFSAGGRTYGYKRVPIEHPSKIDVNGRPLVEAVRRAVDPKESQIVIQIFEWFVAGRSPKWIAHELNRQGEVSPRGNTWGESTIYGDITQGTGLLNNALYIGRYIWNRSIWMKDPDTGKRKRMDRPESEWVVTEMPELRIVPPALWNAAQKRQAEIKEKSVKLREALSNPNTHSRTGRYLFSGLLKCGCCEANFTMCSTTSYGCATNLHGGDAACANRLRVPRRMIEEQLIHAIQNELLSEEAIDLFVKETANFLKEQQGQQPDHDAMKRNLSRVEKEIANIMTAIKAGIITATTKVELEKAEEEKQQITAMLEVVPPSQDRELALVPRLMEFYQKMADSLQEALAHDVAAARQIIKRLIGQVQLRPKVGGYLVAELQRSNEALMGFLDSHQLKANVVAGAGFEPTTFRL